jgi:hypothetical protein
MFHETFNNTSVISWRECFPLSFIDVDSSNVLHSSFLIVDMKQLAILHYCMDTFPWDFLILLIKLLHHLTFIIRGKIIITKYVTFKIIQEILSKK